MDKDEQLLESLSFSIEKDIKNLAKYLEDKGYYIIMCAGDGLLAKGDIPLNYEELKNALMALNNGYTFSVGVGQTLEDAYTALKYAKLNGRGLIICKQADRFEIM